MYCVVFQTIRLRAGAVPWRGRVEIKVNREWGTICQSGFDALDANVVCRHLGFGSVKTVIVRSGPGVGKIHLTQIRLVYSPYNNYDTYAFVTFVSQTP